MLNTHASSRRILVISDFHLTSGQNPVTKQWSVTEDFFWDDAFADLLQYHLDGTPTTLVINGDLIDFMQVLDMPTESELAEFSLTAQEANKRYGLRCTEQAAVFQAAKVMQGHARLCEALALFVACGNEVVFLTGNHDIQLYWPGVQRRITDTLEGICTRQQQVFHPELVRFCSWCYYIPGLVFIEHGNQYESTTAFRNIFNPLLPFDLPHGRRQLDLDLSGFLVRYITNRVERVNPLADNVRPLTQYYSFLWKTHPWLAAWTFFSAAVFVVLAFRKRRLWRKQSIRRAYVQICRKNAQLMRDEARRFSDGTAGDVQRIGRMFSRIRTHLHARPALERHIWPFLRRRNNFLPNIFHVLRGRAQELVRLVGTKFVIFGHSHAPDAFPLGESRMYFNTGTWIPTFTSATPELPDPLQFTFVRIEKGQGSLLRWAPERRQPETITMH
jgi:UDP-2,3-diacylglucosamine pyrophosphatase LpxH